MGAKSRGNYAFRPNPEVTCERCVFGTGEHAEWCPNRDVVCLNCGHAPHLPGVQCRATVTDLLGSYPCPCMDLFSSERQRSSAEGRRLMEHLGREVLDALGPLRIVAQKPWAKFNSCVPIQSPGPCVKCLAQCETRHACVDDTKFSRLYCSACCPECGRGQR